MFLGKTGIFDHNPKGENQTARIYHTAVIKDELKQNALGETYHYLQAKAYMVKSKKNEDMILDIDAGIKKEVSIGCTVKNAVCSICSTDTNFTYCEHQKGKTYDDKLCYIVLDNPTDAYEWSFVAIPAQKNAGVTKRYSAGESVTYLQNSDAMKMLDKYVKSEEKLILSPMQAKEILEHISTLNNYAKLGKAYMINLKEDIVKTAFLCGECVDAKIFANVIDKLNVDELLAYKKAYEKKYSEILVSGSQLMDISTTQKDEDDKQFII